jgi:acetoin utilization deacetylase AcuC-like enzyme
MVASLKLKKEGLVNKVGILDLDNHFGNGTENIIKKLGVDFIHHYTFGAHSIGPDNAEDWLKRLPSIVRDFKNCDLVLFQAGADPHINDPLGGNLTSEQMEQRDFIVFSELKKMGIPTVWNLAGGYQKPLQKVLDLHTNTLKVCLKAYQH